VSARPSRCRRGTTIAETLVVTLILGLMLLAIAGAMPSLFAAPARAQAKADTLDPATAGLYLLERDLRESDASAIFACTGWPAVCGSGAPDVDNSAIAVATAVDSSDLAAQFQTVDEHPRWQGFIVYWQRAAGGNLYRAYEPAPMVSQYFLPGEQDRTALQAMAQNAVAEAAAQPASQVAMRALLSITTTIDSTSGITTLHVVTAASDGSAQNTSTFDDDVLSHN